MSVPVELSLSGAYHIEMTTRANADEWCKITVKDSLGALLDMTSGFVVTMHLKKDIKDTSPYITFTDTTDIERGNGFILIKALKSKKTGKAGKYVYDLKLYKTLGDTTAILCYGNFIILDGVTS